MAENKISDIIQSSLENIREIVDANTIIGNPIPTDGGTTIIPVSKVSIGFASGGVDFASKAKNDANFGGGGGTGLTVTPVAFIAVKPDGNVEMLNVEGAAGVDISALIDKTPAILEKIKGLFKKEKKDDEDICDDDDISVND